MIGPRLVVRWCIVCVLVVVPVCRALGAGTLSAEVRTTTNAQAVRPAIQDLLKAQIPKLTSDDASAHSQAREAIVAEVQPGVTAQNSPSKAFLEAYAEGVNNALLPLAKHSNPRVRLNVAIIAKRVDEQANSSALAPLIIDLLDDESEAVVLWAVKAAKYAIPPVLGNTITRQNVQLLPPLLKAVQKNIKSGPIVQSAYESLRLEQNGPNAVPPANWKMVVPLVVDAVQSLVELRITEYTSGIPAMPTMDVVGTSFLVQGNIWREETPPQQGRTVQLLADLMSVAAKRWPDADASRKQDLTEVVNNSVGGAWVVGNALGNNDVMAKTFKISPSTPAAEVQAKTEDLRNTLNSLKNISGFSGLKPAPALTAMTPATTEESSPDSQ